MVNINEKGPIHNYQRFHLKTKIHYFVLPKGFNKIGFIIDLCV